MTRMIAGSLLVLLAGCGVDWFPAPRPTFTNHSTALGNISGAAKVAGRFTDHSSCGR